jgi:hypothetical protein
MPTLSANQLAAPTTSTGGVTVAVRLSAAQAVLAPAMAATLQASPGPARSLSAAQVMPQATQVAILRATGLRLPARPRLDAVPASPRDWRAPAEG